MPFASFENPLSVVKEPISTIVDPWTDFVMTGVGGLAASGAAWQSTLITNTLNRPAALILLSLVPAVAPTNGTIYEVFLIRGNSASGVRTDNAGAATASIALQNARMIGSLQCTNTLGPFREVFDTSSLGPLGEQWGIILRNSTNQALGVIGSQVFQYQTYASGF